VPNDGHARHENTLCLKAKLKSDKGRRSRKARRALT